MTRTIAALWRDAVARPHTNPAYLVEDGSSWREISWDEAAIQVDELANGLLALGVRKGDAFAILARTTLEWVLFDFALAHVGAIGAPIYPSSSPADCRYVVEHSGAVGILAEDEAQLRKLGQARPQHALTFADLDGLRARGRDHAASHPDDVTGAVAAVADDDVFTYIYTSGTTGPPKGCMIRNRNYFEMAAVVDDVCEFVSAEDLMLLYLPLAHNFGRLMHLLGPRVGLTIALLAEPAAARTAMPAVRPTVMPSVPRIFEKLHGAIVTEFDAATGVKRRLIEWALAVGRRVSALREEQRPVPPTLALQHRIADRLVYRKVKAKLGGRLRYSISGGAPLAPEIARFLHALDLLVLEGYGLTEVTTAVAVNRPSRFRFGTVGPPLPRVEMRTEEDGELVVRSPTVFAGYLNDEQATREILTDDGWLRTGDIGSVDEDGFLRITDRKKDVLVTAGGKNVAPQNLENALKSSKFISQALVVGDRRPYVAALITLDEPEVRRWADEHGVAGELATSDAVRSLVKEIVDGVNAERSPHEQVKRFAILPRDFSPDEGEVTPTLKLKRAVCLAHCADEVERLYA